jgi:PHD/YefM family antitoxin component YafN of YafNO toxin-antitoxin module
MPLTKNTVTSILKSTFNHAFKDSTMAQLNANDIKLRGVSAIEEALTTEPEVTLSVRGKPRFVVMHLDHYHHLRECELEVALTQAKADVAAGRVVHESPEQHLARLDRLS